MKCPKCGSENIVFEYGFIYDLGGPRPVQKNGTCTCKSCHAHWPHSEPITYGQKGERDVR